ncbi:hypothetical protein EDD18DRAFT_676927 [Armillaria luteobubalina]|uniref:Uncharacterized protein n=1 Tax=Armillaria luteobubalina TaxID=153913 RepID=A0AA39QFD5_9AGAR|nr:hypothetical protein EDD18DRAFT_676927 [Armillaria luteobubalina]
MEVRGVTDRFVLLIAHSTLLAGNNTSLEDYSCFRQSSQISLVVRRDIRALTTLRLLSDAVLLMEGPQSVPQAMIRFPCPPGQSRIVPPPVSNQTAYARSRGCFRTSGAIVLRRCPRSVISGESTSGYVPEGLLHGSIAKRYLRCSHRLASLRKRNEYK